MNAKKIMGAVLVALLALAVFAGAGAAATYFAYEKNTGLMPVFGRVEPTQLL